MEKLVEYFRNKKIPFIVDLENMKCEELNITQKRKDEIILGALHRFIAVIYEPLDKIFEKVPLSNIILDRQ